MSEDEERRLLAAAPPFFRAMLITAIDTGLRRAELLALRFRDIDQVERQIVVRGETAKSGKTRHVPISTDRLLAVLRWLQKGEDGQEKPDTAIVFSNLAGETVGSFRRAWDPTREARGR